jgi:hypothetical protein
MLGNVNADAPFAQKYQKGIDCQPASAQFLDQEINLIPRLAAKK